MLAGLAVLASSGWADNAQLKYRWLFIFRDLTKPEEVDRTIALLPGAAADGYTGLVLSWHIASQKVEQLKAEAAKYKLDLIPTVMGGVSDPNMAEGLPVKDAAFIAHNGKATLVPDPQASLAGGDFENAQNDRFAGWETQEAPGKCTFQDRKVAHDGQASVRMENFDQASKGSGCYVAQTVTGPCTKRAGTTLPSRTRTSMSGWWATSHRPFSSPPTLASPRASVCS
jgi:hypothetical protein